MRHDGTIAHLKQNKLECSLGHKSASLGMVDSTIMRKCKQQFVNGANYDSFFMPDDGLFNLCEART
jgi:hypothetical protein